MAIRMYEREPSHWNREKAGKTAATWEGIEHYRKTGKLPAYDGNLSDTEIEIAAAVRADAESAQGGLTMTTRFDESGRPIREFANTGSRKRWMDAYRSTPQLQIRINKKGDPPGSAEALAYQARWEATQAMIASGNITLPEV